MISSMLCPLVPMGHLGDVEGEKQPANNAAVQVLEDMGLAAKVAATYSGYYRDSNKIDVAFCAVNDYRAAVIKKLNEDSQ